MEMAKSRKSKEVGGEQDTNLSFRLSTASRERFNKARAVGIPRSGAKLVRPFLDHYSEFTEANGRQPLDHEELYAWVLRRKKK
jgi:hypothetical protein